MAQLREIYRCEVCGNVVEVVNDSSGELKCCEKPMIKLDAKTEDAGQEKHVPVVEEAERGVKVKVGSVEHPMAEDHYIKFIEVMTDKKVYRCELKAGEAPEASFCCPSKENIVEVREYCTVHGLWKS